MRRVKITIYFFLFIKIAFYCNAQTFTLSEPLESIRESVKIIGKIQNNIILYKENSQKKVLQIFSSDLKPLREIELEFSKNQIEIIHFVIHNESINIFYAHHQKGKTIFRNKIIDNQFTEHSDILLISSDEVLSFQLLKWVMSENKNKFLLYTAVPGIQLFWFSFDLTEKSILKYQTKKNYESIFEDYFNSMLINNSGEIFFMIEKDNSIFRKNMHQIEYYSIKSDSFKLINKINLNSKLVSDYRLIYDEQNKKLNYIALYGNNFSRTTGVLNYVINYKDNDSAKEFIFEDSLVRNMTGKKRKKYAGIPNLIIKDVILRKDGGCILIAEQFFRYEYRLPSSPYNDLSIIRNISYFYENVMVLSLNPDGSLLWREILHKSQKSENDDGIFSSLFILRNSGHLRFLFNDLVQPTSGIYEFSINGKGIAKRTKIFDNDDKQDSDLIPEFRYAMQTASNEIIIQQKRYNKLKLIKISYN